MMNYSRQGGVSGRGNNHGEIPFAFDLGTNSIGWAVYRLNQANHPVDLVDAGVRIFSDGRDPKSGASLAENRRGPRAMPADEAGRKALEKLDPYVLRRKGLDEKLSLHDLGRALFHLNQRRGFQSNRIADAGMTTKAARSNRQNKAEGASGRTGLPHLWRIPGQTTGASGGPQARGRANPD